MAFFDEARIQAISGKGGNGCLSFRREKYIPRGGPDGGDGGNGGDVVVTLDNNLNSLNHLKGKKVFAAKAGKSGAGKNMKGCLLYTSPSPRDNRTSRMPSSA